MKTEEIFDSIVQNAIDFMTTAVNELKIRPKYSVINFYNAIELFFKARILREHWALIVKQPEKISKIDFKNGDFQSIGVNEAILRLKNICGQSFTKEETDCFEDLREHRNKLVHFFNSKYTENPSEETIYEIISEQCKGWFYLNKLLNEKWEVEFVKYRQNILDLNKLMHSHREYLRAKFEALNKQIQEEQRNGAIFADCFICGFKSAREESETPLVEHSCLVCGKYLRVLKVPCPECSGQIYIEDSAEGKCKECDREIDLGYLIEEYGPDQSTKEYFTEPTIAHCKWCGRLEKTVIPFGDEWLCLSCLEPHPSIAQCDFCGEMSTGDMSDSYTFGCTVCKGSAGWND